MDIHVRITSPVFVLLMCFLAFSTSLVVFVFISVITVTFGINSFGLGHQRPSTMASSARNIVRGMIYWVIAGFKGGWYPSRREHRNRHRHRKSASQQLTRYQFRSQNTPRSYLLQERHRITQNTENQED